MNVCDVAGCAGSRSFKVFLGRAAGSRRVWNVCAVHANVDLLSTDAGRLFARPA